MLLFFNDALVSEFLVFRGSGSRGPSRGSGGVAEGPSRLEPAGPRLPLSRPAEQLLSKLLFYLRVKGPEDNAEVMTRQDEVDQIARTEASQ